jgi:hypothetical protein
MSVVGIPSRCGLRSVRWQWFRMTVHPIVSERAKCHAPKERRDIKKAWPETHKIVNECPLLSRC